MRKKDVLIALSLTGNHLVNSNFGRETTLSLNNSFNITRTYIFVLLITVKLTKLLTCKIKFFNLVFKFLKFLL